MYSLYDNLIDEDVDIEGICLRCKYFVSCLDNRIIDFDCLPSSCWRFSKISSHN